MGASEETVGIDDATQIRARVVEQACRGEVPKKGLATRDNTLTPILGIVGRLISLHLFARRETILSCRERNATRRYETSLRGHAAKS